MEVVKKTVPFLESEDEMGNHFSGNTDKSFNNPSIETRHRFGANCRKSNMERVRPAKS